MRRSPLLLAGAIVAACGSSSSSPPPDDTDPETFAQPPDSCAYICPLADCAEQTTNYACPSMAAWDKIPHADACPKWDGKTPDVKQGQCTSTAPTGDAAKYAGPDGAAHILPDGRRITPSGVEWVFAEPDLAGGLTTAAVGVPGTSFVVTVDTGPGDHAVRVIDASKLDAAGTSPVTSYVRFQSPATLNSGVVFIPPNRVFVATNDGVVQAMTLDTTTGMLANDDAHSIALPSSKDPTGKAVPWYASGVAASPDKKLLVVTPVADQALFVYDPSTGQKLGELALPAAETFGAWFDDADSTHVYVSMWSKKQVLDVDVSKPASPKVARTLATDKDPQQIAFLDARWMVVANDLGDTVSVIDRTSGAVRSVPIDAAQPLHGSEPSTLAYDAPRKRLYVTLSGVNAVAAYDVDLGQTPPALTPAGRIATAWWPSGVVPLADGALVITSMRGHGSGPRAFDFAIGDSDISDRMRGSVQKISAQLAAQAPDGALVDTNDAVAQQDGHPTVTCPPGADDFPVPATNTQGPSKQIDHVFFIVRENKDFDGLMGDMPGVEGHPDLTLKKTEDMDKIWQNLRALAKTFAHSDNFYSDAVYSTQGHNWTTYGRATDFDERTWAISGSGRDARLLPLGGIGEVGKPDEGSLFDWLDANGLQYDILGEAVGAPAKLNPDHPPIDVKYPGGPVQNILYNDLQKTCYAAGRVRVRCDLGSFVYMTVSNDHTGGVSPKSPSPETYCAVNDEATGTIVDAITHSPLWPSSVIFITEDDPSQGGEHIDSHRTILLAISPWVKRGYVSKTHADVASVHKMFAHIFGKPYPNRIVANAALPLDLFTSTPDYTPYDYKPRVWPLACGAQATPGEKALTDSWDFEEADEQPGLDAQVTRWMRGRQFEVLPPNLRARAEARTAAKAR